MLRREKSIFAARFKLTGGHDFFAIPHSGGLRRPESPTASAPKRASFSGFCPFRATIA
jgi:hypothetical protein